MKLSTAFIFVVSFAAAAQAVAQFKVAPSLDSASMRYPRSARSAWARWSSIRGESRSSPRCLG